MEWKTVEGFLLGKGPRMKRLSLAMMAAAVVGLAGCSGSVSTKPGGVTAPHRSDSASVGKGSFKLEAKPVTVKQGDKATTTIQVDREGSFKEAVEITVESPDPKITVDPKSFPMPPEVGKKDIAIGAAADATPQDYTLTVTGKPSVGETTKVDFKVTVKAK